MNRRRWIRHARIAAAATVAVSFAVTALVVVRDHETTPQALAPATAEGRALLTARTEKKPVKVESLTSATTEVWAKPDGALEAHIAAGTVRMPRAGRWVTIDPTLEARDDVVVPKAHPGELILAGERPAGDHELAAIGTGTERVAMHWTGRLPAPRLSGSEATYPEVRDGVDLVVRASRTGFEQSLVVKDKAAAARIGAIRFRLSGPGAARHVRATNGSITLMSAAGKATMQIPRPEMWDATLTPAGVPATTTPVRTTVETGGSGTVLVLQPDPRWLRDRARAYPITIDPTLNPARISFDTYVRQTTGTNAHTANDLWLGLYATEPPTITRSFITWDSAVLSGKHITKATVKFTNFWSHTCTATGWQIWTTTAATTSHTYASQPTWASAASATSTQTKGSTGCADGTVEIDGKAFFQHFANAKSSTAHMGLRAQDETKTAGFKQFRSSQGAADEVPVAVVDYQAPPLITARSTDPATACVTGAGRPAINSLTPKLSVSVSDADATALTVDFEWYRVGESTKLGGTTVNLAAKSGTVSATVPAGQMIEGGAYSWRVRVSDGVAGSSDWDKSCEFSTYLTAPPAGGCTPGTESDFNGDGISDVAAADPSAVIGGKEQAGQVTVIYGGTAKPTAVLSQDNVGGQSVAGDQFGRSVASYDANNDGCSDLAVAAPFKEVGTVADAGAVALVLGSPQGLGKGPATQWYSQNTTAWGDGAEVNDWFGWSVAAGRTAAGESYLVVGVPGEDVGTVLDAGLIHYVRGTSNATLYAGSGLPTPAKTDDRLGYSVAGSPHHLAFGLPGRTIGTAAFAGAVQVNTHELVSGLPKALATFDQSTVETAEANDNFGKSVALAAYRPAGTAAGTPVSLLLVGVPGEDVDAVADAGRVQRYRLTTTAASLGGITQNTFGTAEVAEAGDYFGEKVQLISTRPAEEATAATLQAAVGVPGEDLGGVADAGLVSVFGAATDPVTPSGLTVLRGSTSLPGPLTEGELLGGYLGSSGGRLWVPSPRSGQLFGLLWSDLAAGNRTPAVTHQNPSPAIG